MRYTIVLTFLIICSCTENRNASIIRVLENEQIMSELQKLDEPERALVSWYLFAYGNACKKNSNKTKCRILQGLGVKDECDPEHLNMLLQWFSTDMLAVYKLKKCPNLAAHSAIQNTFDKIILQHKGDTLFIDYNIKGLNNSQEKSWNIEQIDSYFIRNKTLVKIESHE